ncbi:hypothetical protein ACJ41O_009963 [Fusarium nematophilum]
MDSRELTIIYILDVTRDLLRSYISVLVATNYLFRKLFHSIEHEARSASSKAVDEIRQVEALFYEAKESSEYESIPRKLEDLEKRFEVTIDSLEKNLAELEKHLKVERDTPHVHKLAELDKQLDVDNNAPTIDLDRVLDLVKSTGSQFEPLTGILAEIRDGDPPYSPALLPEEAGKEKALLDIRRNLPSRRRRGYSPG